MSSTRQQIEGNDERWFEPVSFRGTDSIDMQELSSTLSTIRNKHYVETLRAIERAKYQHREIVQKTLQALAGQQEGLMQLTEIVQSDKSDVDVMARK
ncbi:hypothetical protein HDV00_000151 [Rhizophlyctis rosea]|nr:hypothetical protein HDV00_000151 [Rhizophlyctis rosea]